MTSAKEMYIEIFLNQGSIQTNEVIITASKMLLKQSIHYQ